MKAEPTKDDTSPFYAEVIGTISERKENEFLSLLYALRRNMLKKDASTRWKLYVGEKK